MAREKLPRWSASKVCVRPTEAASRFWVLIPFDRSTSCRSVDRKSTRLNSSHGYISYAVFCLKKKIEIRVLRPFIDHMADRQYRVHRRVRGGLHSFNLRPHAVVIITVPLRGLISNLAVGKVLH